MKIFQNLRAKLTILIFAVIFWLTVITEDTYNAVFEIPLQIQNIRPGKALAAVTPKTVRVKFEGNGKALALVRFTEVSMRVDAANLRDRTTLILKKHLDWISVPRGFDLKVLEVEWPDTLQLVLDKVKEKRVAVYPRWEVRPVEGYLLAQKPKIQPDTVLLSGPEKILEKVDSVFTEEKKYPDKKFSFSETLKCKWNYPDLLQSSPPQVRVDFSVEKLAEREVYNVPVQIKNVPPSLTVEVIPATLSLLLRGGSERLSQLQPEEIIAYIDYQKDWHPNQTDYPVVIQTPFGVTFLESRPRKFEIITRKKN